MRTEPADPAGWLARMRGWARAIKRDVVAVWHAARDPRTPWAVRVLAMAVAAYALSPIDLIPDFIPVLGYLDDVVLVPLGLLLVLRLLPPAVLADARAQAQATLARPRSRLAAACFVVVWLAGLLAGSAALLGWWRAR